MTRFLFKGWILPIYTVPSLPGRGCTTLGFKLSPPLSDGLSSVILTPHTVNGLRETTTFSLEDISRAIDLRGLGILLYYGL